MTGGSSSEIVDKAGMVKMNAIECKSGVPLISVVVPVYNSEKYIEECIESVLIQTYPNWELVLVDDGSTDSSLAKCALFADLHDNIRVFHTENKGVSHARNIGLGLSEGEYITFLDADDLLMPNSLEVLYSALLGHDCDMSIGRKNIARMDGAIIETPFPNSFELWKGDDGLVAALEDHPATHSVWGKLYRSAFFENVKFDEVGRIHEDSFYIFECMLKKPTVVVVDDCVLVYRATVGSASRSDFSEKMTDILYFLERKKEIILDHEPQMIDLVRNMEVKACMSLLLNLCKSKGSTYKDLERDCLGRIAVNRGFFIPASEWDLKWFGIIVHGLYPLYKWVYRLRRQRGRRCLDE